MALIAGVVLTAVGLVGLFGTTLLGFGLNTPHNLLHLASGLMGMWAVWKGLSRAYNQWLGGSTCCWVFWGSWPVVSWLRSWEPILLTTGGISFWGRRWL
jgi:hypothetical protein